MHTIEASVLVPMGLGLISLLLMITFFLHDQTVLTAEYSAALLEWQCSPGKQEEDSQKDRLEQNCSGLLITQIEVEQFTAGSTVCQMKVRENYRLFSGVLKLLEQSVSTEEGERSIVLTKTNPCGIKRIWEVVGWE